MLIFLSIKYMKPVDPNKAHGQSLSNESSNGKVKTDDLKNDSDDEWEIVSESEKRASVHLPISTSVRFN